MAKRVDERPVAGFNLVASIDGEGLALHYDGALRPVQLRHWRAILHEYLGIAYYRLKGWI